MNVPENLLYTETHEWLRIEGETACVGITDHAQEELTDIVFVEAPKAGTEIEAKQAVAVVESVKAASDIYAPVGGTVLEANPALESDPGLVNRDPYGEGWLFRMKLGSAAEANELKKPGEYRDLIASSGGH
jgi:glycine cleavage system H protein